MYINLIKDLHNVNHNLNSEVKKMKQVIVNGVSYLGDLEVTDNGVVVKDAIQIGQVVTRADVTRYFEESNVGNLKSVSFGGNGISFSEMELDDDIKNYLQIAKLVMDQAKSVAVRKLENTEYRNELGKFTGGGGPNVQDRNTGDYWQA
jgi:hypothetical protein